MKKSIIALTAASVVFCASTAEAGPLRNLLGRLKGKPRAVAAKVVKAPAAALGANVGSCANGRCSK